MTFTFEEPPFDPAQTFRYRFYDIMQATFLGDMPLEAVGFGQRLNTPGSFNATLPLSDPRVDINLDATQATQPGRTLIIVDLDGDIVWGGILWTRQFSRSTRALTLGGQEATSYFAHRVQAGDYTSTWATTAADPLVIAKRVIEDCLAVPFSAFHPGGAFAMPVVLNYQEAISPADYITVSYPITQLQTLDTILQNLSGMGYGTGFDYSIDWTYVSGVPSPTCNLSYPRRGFIAGLTPGTAPNALESHPAYDYTYPEDATSQANKVYVTASQSSGTSDTAVDDPASFTAGYPLLEEVANFTQVNTGAQLSALAEGELATHSHTPTTPVVDVTPFGNFPLGGFECGDDIRWIVPAQVQIAGPGDERFPGGPTGIPFSTVAASGLDATYRIASWDATIGDEGVSHLALTLSLPPPIKPSTPSSLYVPQLLADLQAQVAGLATSGGGGKTYATVVVAASDSRSIAADFVCAGATDEATINLAIAALPSDLEVFGTYGKIVLLEGVYNTAAPIVIPVAFGFTSNVVIEGMASGSSAGTGSLIRGSNTGTSADDYDLLQIGQSESSYAMSVEIHHLAFHSNANGVRAGKELACVHMLAGGTPVIHDCSFSTSSAAYATVAQIEHGTWSVLICSQNLSIPAVGIGGLAGTFSPMVYNNFFDGGAGVRLWYSDGAQIFNNTFDGTSSGIEFVGAHFDHMVAFNYFDGCCFGTPVRPAIFCEGGDGDIVITGNFFDAVGGPGILLDSCSQATITGNNLYTYNNQVTDDDATAFPLRLDPSVTVGSHGVAVRYSYHGSFNYIGPVTITGNDMTWTTSAVSIIRTNPPGGTPSTDPFAGFNIHGNTAVFAGPDLFSSSPLAAVAAIHLDGGTHGIVHCNISDNLISVPFYHWDTHALDDGIKLENNVSYCLVANNHLDDGAHSSAGTSGYHWGSESAGPWPIHIATSDCLHNYVTGNYCAPGYIKDQGTGTVRFANLYGTEYALDGPNGGSFAPSLAFFLGG